MLKRGLIPRLVDLDSKITGLSVYQQSWSRNGICTKPLSMQTAMRNVRGVEIRMDPKSPEIST